MTQTTKEQDAETRLRHLEQYALEESNIRASLWFRVGIAVGVAGTLLVLYLLGVFSG